MICDDCIAGANANYLARQNRGNIDLADHYEIEAKKAHARCDGDCGCQHKVGDIKYLSADKVER